MDSRGRTVVITGAAADTDSVIACILAEKGCGQIFLGDSGLQSLQESRDKILSRHPSTRVFVKAFNRSEEAEVHKFFVDIMRVFERIDIAVNLVCQNQAPQATAEISLEDYARSYTVFQRGAFLIQRDLLRQMLEQDILPQSKTRGNIVNIVELGPTSSLADRPLSAIVANAIVGLSKTDAFDFAPDNIRVNCIAASEVLTTTSAEEAEKPASTSDVVPIDRGSSLHSTW
ncbi:hypothetical protein LTS17_011512 [Exophiala oligosperma]